MPKVGNKHFSYTKQGQKQAQQYARNTGQKVAVKKPPKKK